MEEGKGWMIHSLDHRAQAVHLGLHLLCGGGWTPECPAWVRSGVSRMGSTPGELPCATTCSCVCLSIGLLVTLITRHSIAINRLKCD